MAYNALKSGFVSTVVIQTWVYPKSSTEPVAWTRDRRTVVYDLWDEVYTVTFQNASEQGVPLVVQGSTKAWAWVGKEVTMRITRPVSRILRRLPPGCASTTPFTFFSSSINAWAMG